jgi:hypothetical protein
LAELQDRLDLCALAQIRVGHLIQAFLHNSRLSGHVRIQRELDERALALIGAFNLF